MVGPEIRKLRYQQELTQPLLAARCARYGWITSRETIAKIEAQFRWVSDFELLCLAQSLGVSVSVLLPEKAVIAKTLRDFFESRSSG